MKRQFNVTRNMKAALCLGLAALLINTAFEIAIGSPAFPLGNIFLFTCAIALGPWPTLTALAVAVVPTTILVGPPQIAPLRIVLICMVTALALTRWPRLPGFVPAALLWAFLFAPVLALFKHTLIANEPTFIHMAPVTAFSDIIFATVAGVFMLNPSLWGLITGQARHISLPSVLVHFGTLLTSVCVYTCFVLWLGAGAVSWPASLWQSPWSLALLFVLSVGLPALVSFRLADLLAVYKTQLISDSLSMTLKEPGIFSGLTSDFWRRRTREQEDQFKSASSSELNQTRQTVETPDGAKTLPVAEGGSWDKIISPDSNDGVLALDSSGQVLYANRAFCELVELRHSDPVGKRIESLSVAPAIRTAIANLLETTLRRGPRSSELKLNTLPEKLRFFMLSSQIPSTPMAGELSHLKSGSVVITVRDITQRRTLEKNWLQGQKLGSLGTLVNGIGHAFNNVLTTIAGQASYARHSKDNGAVEQALSAILRSTQEAGNLVRQLLEFADTQRQAQLKPENLVHALEERLALLQRLIGESYEIRLERKVQSPIVVCDINLILQAITNLVLNAREACSSSRGVIRISLDTEHFDDEISQMHAGAYAGDFARLRVSDDGCGMTQEILAHAFEPLYTNKASGGHIGLGLASVFAIVRAHDGFLSAESHPERGTTVSLYLPLQAEVEDSASSNRQTASTTSGVTSEADSLAQLHGNSEQILVVEDDQNIREVISSMLATIGYQVQSCADGSEALQRCTEREFDLILVDMVMPRIAGLELIDRIRETKPGAKALLMTGYGGTAVVPPTAVKVINKPFDIETLAQAVKCTLQSPPDQPQEVAAQSPERQA